MPSLSDASANENLELFTQSGGADWELVLLSTEPDAKSSGGTVITDLDAVAVSRDSSSWSTPASRSTHLVFDPFFGAATVATVAVAWLLREGDGTPVHSGLLAGRGISIGVGSEVNIAGSQVSIKVPPLS